MKRKYPFLITSSVVVLLLSANSIFAQPKPDTAKNKTVKPVITSYIGPYSGGKALSGDIKKLMSLNPTVKVKDAKGIEYKVISYEITWKKKELSDDIRTGKAKTVFYMVGADVKSNLLPESWRTEINAGIKAGEEIGISNILYNDAKKKMNYKAPDILIAIL